MKVGLNLGPNWIMKDHGGYKLGPPFQSLWTTISQVHGSHRDPDSSGLKLLGLSRRGIRKFLKEHNNVLCEHTSLNSICLFFFFFLIWTNFLIFIPKALSLNRSQKTSYSKNLNS